jgi:polyhydroxyalkanoate synthesis regulator phasin
MDLLGGNVGSMGLDGSQAFGITAGGLESADEADQSIDEFLAFIQHMEASGQITSDEAKEMSHWMKMAKNAGATTARNAIDMANIFGGANTAIQNKLKGLFKLQMSLAATARKNDNKGLSRKLKIKARDTNAMTTSLETAATGNFFGVNNAINSDPPPALSRIVKQRATNLRDYKDQKAAAATQSARNAAVKNALNPTNGLSFDSRSKKIWDEVKAGRMSQSQGKKIINGLAKEMIGSTNKLNIGYEGSKILDAYNEAKNNGTLGTEKQDQFRTDYSRASAQGDKQGQADAMNLLGQEGKTWEDYIAKEGSGIDKNTTWRDLKGMANGGVINEPILGIGRSGQGYQFGESGKEFVTPERKAGGTTFNVININVGNVNRDADFDKLKPLIQRWILESNSRRGMI